MSYTIVGVIGHIDHGKTALVAALTGVDTDTHPEEKRRGITIDLGFASFTTGDHQFALIDAPGHEKYIGNLLAGVSGIDVGLLVVACDQGIQEQTLEHASILRLLGAERLIVALTRTDLATNPACRELPEELELFLEDVGFSDVPMIPVSSVTRTGLDTLQAELCRVAGGLTARPTGRCFRMPVDRVFSMPGRGCVVAGTIWSGSVRVGDSLQLADSGATTRIREIEIHGKAVESSTVGFRTALNLTGLSSSDIRRGDELIQPGVFRAAQHFLVEIQPLKTSREIKCPATLQLHLATNACAARVMGVRRLSPGKAAVVVVETERPVIATFGQTCLFRLPHPVGTLAGGKVLAAVDHANSRTRKMIDFGKRLAMSDPASRLVAWVDFLGEADPRPEWCELQVGIPIGASLPALITEIVSAGAVLKVPDSPRLFATGLFDRIGGRIRAILTQPAGDSHNAWRVDDSLVEQLREFGSVELIRLVLQSLLDGGSIVRVNNLVALATAENRLSTKQKARMDQIIRLFDSNRTPPSLNEVADELHVAIETVRSLCRFAVQSGILTDVGNGLFVATSVFRRFCSELHREFVHKPEISVADIRDLWQVTRKHAIPFLEYCDRMKVTIRIENKRSAGSALTQFLTPSPAPPAVSSEPCDI